MKLKLILCLIIPCALFSQSRDNNSRDLINIKYETGIDNLINKHQNIQRNKDGILGWRIQLAFKSTKEEINNEVANGQKACSIIDPDCEACQ